MQTILYSIKAKGRYKSLEERDTPIIRENRICYLSGYKGTYQLSAEIGHVSYQGKVDNHQWNYDRSVISENGHTIISGIRIDHLSGERDI